ncbi:MAG TPA: precorrin-4 C(11)-methyltransferase [Candidatus Avalokitesvara rifleensis]|uniref:precorrin-4 C(11)-methyltransferase n=1 Tax=Candidatus Avalokitesvara rifleensis TaxID=3367620 RepID=UPI002712D1E8|nr:precorrin-4 C(11)-methyltransferase [Candidatus Brocadiales bacterium]
MKVYFIGAGPGDPELLTIKGKKILEKVGYCLYAGSLVNEELLGYTRPGTRHYNTHGMSLEEQLKVINEAQERDEDVARLHTGDPSIYGAIQEQMKALDAVGIDYEVIPGVSSFLAAAASLKQELTLPGVSQTVIVTRVEGQTPVPAKESLKVLAQSKATLCIFLSANQIEKIVGELLPSYGPDCPAAVVYKSTWKEEKIVRTPLSKLAEGVKREGIKKTALIIVGEVLARDFERSQVYQPR